MFKIKEDDLTGVEIQDLLAEHLDRMTDHSPPQSRHVLDVKSLQQPEITFWSMWEHGELVGCVALKHWDDQLGEIKSMKTSPAFIRRGVGKRLLEHVISAAKTRCYQQLKLETGSMDYFEPARKLYQNHGFKHCGPFGDYVEDSNNVFMQLKIA